MESPCTWAANLRQRRRDPVAVRTGQIMLERPAPVFRAGFSAWLKSHGF